MACVTLTRSSLYSLDLASVFPLWSGKPFLDGTLATRRVFNELPLPLLRAFLDILVPLVHLTTLPRTYFNLTCLPLSFPNLSAFSSFSPSPLLHEHSRLCHPVHVPHNPPRSPTAGATTPSNSLSSNPVLYSCRLQATLCPRPALPGPHWTGHGVVIPSVPPRFQR